MSKLIKDLGAVSAYAYAVEKGYTGTEDEFAELMYDYTDVAQTAVEAKDEAVSASASAQASATTANTKADEASASASKAQSASDSAQGAETNAETFALNAGTKATEAKQFADKAELNAQKTQSDKEAVESAKSDVLSAVDNAQNYANSAQSASQAIQNMDVEATTLEPDSDATVEKTVDSTSGVVTLTYGIPKGQVGEKGDKGDTGDSGVYIGTSAPLDTNVNVWIDSDGEPDDVIQIDDTLTQSGRAADAKKTGDEITNLKEDLTVMTGNTAIELTDGYTIYTSDTTYDKSSRVANNEYCYAVVPCSEGDAFTITGVGGYSPRLWAFGDGTNVLSKSDVAQTANSKVITAPTGATELIINMRLVNPHWCIIGELLKKKAEDIYNLGNVPVLPDIAIKTRNVLESFALNSVSYTFNITTSNINNYAAFATASSYAKNTPPIQIRNSAGHLIYKNLRLNLDEEDKETICMWLFGKDGYYLRSVQFNEFYHRGSYFLDDEYYVILNSYPSVSGYTDFEWIVDRVNINWLNSVGNNVYYVGTGGDFSTFTEMLTALEDDDTNKTVYVKPGVYDIFTEVGGADRMAELASTAASLNWRDVCKVVPPNTTVIGIGDVTLTWNATAEQMINADVAWLFSPLNLSGNCTIENIKVVAKNCRYAVHDETSNLTQYNGAKHILKNCCFEMLNSDVSGSIAYGSGHNKNMTLVFDNCEFVNYQATAWSTHHHSANDQEASMIVFNNCIFRTTNGSLSQFFAVRFVTSVNNALKDRVRFNNCFIDGYMYFYASGNATQGYDVKLVGSSHVDIIYSESITTRYDVMQYNSLG